MSQFDYDGSNSIRKEVHERCAWYEKSKIENEKIVSKISSD